MLNVIIGEGLYDKEFVERWCTGFDELAARVKPYAPEKVEEITWVPVSTILDVARLYATSKPSLLSWGLGNSLLGKATYSAVLGKCFLRAITGNLDVQGGHPFDDMPKQIAFREEMHWDKLFDHPLRKRDNVSAHLWPIASVRGLKLFREAMAEVHPEGVGPASYMLYPSATSAWSAILDEDPYPVKAAITQGTNALVSFANSRRIHQAMTSDNLELHVVMDHFMTPTAQLADYVMPATDALERVTILPSALWGFGNAYTATAAFRQQQLGQADSPDFNKAREQLLSRVVLDLKSQNTVEEITNAADIFLEMDVERVILVSSPSHVVRALRDATDLFARNNRFARYQDNVLASPSVTCYEGSTPADVVVIEPPHRPDRHVLPTHRRIQRMLDLQKMSGDELVSLIEDFDQLLQRYEHRAYRRQR